MTPAKGFLFLLATASLSGCMSGGLPYMPKPAWQKKETTAEASAVDRQKSSFAQGEAQQSSEILATLLERKTILTADSAYGEVAAAALAAGGRAAEAELRSARLRARAENKNWLPTLSPTVSLTSLGETLASLVVDQVLYDNGRRKAERDYAAADVEVAAVTLSEEMNDRVYTALKLYLDSQRGDEKTAASTKAINQMQALQRIVDGRVAGGVSDKGDQRMVESKILDLRASRDIADESAAIARAELKAITGQGFSAAPVVHLTDYAPVVEPISVLKARAEANRTVASAVAQRAAQLPGLSLSGSISQDGNGAALNAGGTQGFGFGTKDRIKAIENTKETARENVVEAREAARRNQSRLRNRITSLQRQEAETARLVKDSRDTFNLFREQFRAGQRSVLEVVNVYEQLARRELDRIDAKYDVVLLQLELARDLGVLAEGDQI